MSPPRRPRRGLGRPELLLSIGTVVVVLGLVEIAARVFVGLRWSDEKLELVTSSAPERGKFEALDGLPYALRRGWTSSDGLFSHNQLGFRGPEIEAEKPPGAFRVAMIGASTTYNILVADHETAAARLQARLRVQHPATEVLNAGVMGYTSREVLQHLRARVLPVQPDLVIVYFGRNELFPQVWNGFRPDYAHYRDADYDLRTTNLWLKRLNRVSYTFMALAHRGDRHSLGWEGVLEHPIYGSLVHALEPSVDEVLEHIGRPDRRAPFRDNLEAIVTASREANARVLLATMAYVPAKFGSGVITEHPRLLEPLGRQVEGNNEVVRAVAEAMHVPLVETATLAARRIEFTDDCHAYAEGLDARAQLLFDAIIQHDLEPKPN